MALFPDFDMNGLNGWLPLALFFAIYGVLLIVFGPETRRRLYEKVGWTRSQRMAAWIGFPFGLAGLVVIVLTPLKFGTPIFLLGLLLYCLGTAGFVISLLNFHQTDPGSPAVNGLYKWSRNPQWISFAVVVLSCAIMVGSWAALLLLSVRVVLNHARIRGEEAACLAEFGEQYQHYMDSVPRYILR